MKICEKRSFSEIWMKGFFSPYGPHGFSHCCMKPLCSYFYLKDVFHIAFVISQFNTGFLFNYLSSHLWGGGVFLQIKIITFAKRKWPPKEIEVVVLCSAHGSPYLLPAAADLSTRHFVSSDMQVPYLLPFAISCLIMVLWSKKKTPSLFRRGFVSCLRSL